MSSNIKKFCKTLNFNFLDKLNSTEKNEVKLLLNILNLKKFDIKNIKQYELLKTYFFKENKFRNDKWIIKNIIGKPGKDGTAYIVLKNDNPYTEYVMKEFKPKKSFEKVRNEVKLQTIGSLYNISPKIYEYGSKPNPYIIMDKMNNGTIIDVIKKQNGELTLEQQQQLINIYNTLNDIGINHNDMNLRNLMFNDGKLYIIDYGFSKLLKPGENNFDTLNLMLITMSGFQSVLRKPPMLLIPFLQKDIHKIYWLSKK